jgi:hypothetical protein
VDFLAGGKVWSYGLALDAEGVVVEEWLLELREGVEILGFRRVPDGPIDLGEALPVPRERQQFLRFTAEGTRPEQPFFSEFRSRNIQELAFLVAFAESSDLIGPDPAEDGEDELVRQILRDPDTGRVAQALLAQAGMGVRSVELEPRTTEAERHLAEPKPVDSATAGRLAPDVRLWFGQGESGRLRYRELSDGTRRLLHLADPLLDGLHGVSNLLLIDELDRSLHPALVRWLVRRLLELPEQPGGRLPVQFLFTTHDTNLLDAGVFDRSGVWFVEKGADGAARLHSLADVDPAQVDALTSRLGLGYLQGRFGGTPDLGGP